MTSYSWTPNRRSSESRAPRSIESFETIPEFLLAVHDAIEGHQKSFKETGDTHGNVNLKTLFIGAPSLSSNRRGFLGNAAPGSENPMFQSVNIISKSIIGRMFCHEPDYLDDLESFYYIIAWVCYGYQSPGVRLPTKELPRLLASLVRNPTSRDAALYKEEMFWGNGFPDECGPYSGYDLQFLSPREIIGSLLKSFHEVLKAQYKFKMQNGQPTLRESYQISTDVYTFILGEIKKSVYVISTYSAPPQMVVSY